MRKGDKNMIHVILQSESAATGRIEAIEARDIKVFDSILKVLDALFRSPAAKEDMRAL